MIDINDVTHEILNNPNKLAELKEEEIEEYLDRVPHVLEEERALIELQDASLVFVGDTHGDFETTKAVVKRFFDMDHLVFLGDYIDREPVRWGAIYNITYLLLLKQCYPKKIILLKGNHECNYITPCFPYEFEEELIQRYGSNRLHKKFVEAFSLMPLMVLGNNVFAAHGGILKGADLDMLKAIGKNDPVIIESIVWSDSVISPTMRGAGDSFDEKELTEFLDNIGAKVFVRGHDYNTLGVSIYNDRCLTIFSSSRYKEMGNRGILVARAEKKVSNATDLVVEDFSTGRWRKYQIMKR
ncbi:MAG TPA: serine/threonine protein phosphatase [Thermoplasmata archaeon]|nr:serine/threonine protein phosphatase [Thermoplasmata archaeon]